MISTTITINSITQLRRHTQILKVKRVPHLQINTNFHPHTISFTTRSTKQTNNILKNLHLQALQPLQHRAGGELSALILNLKSLFDMNIPVKKDYTRNLIIDCLHGNELQVGDTVYYLSHTSRYAIRKSTIVGMKEIPFSHHSRPFGGCELMLADSTVLEYYDVFDSKERALEYIVADLKSSLAHKRIGLQTILHEIAEDERLLTIFENKLP